MATFTSEQMKERLANMEQGLKQAEQQYFMQLGAVENLRQLIAEVGSKEPA